MKAYEEQLLKDGMTYFIHKTMRYFKKIGKRRVYHCEMPTISGLIFIQGEAAVLQSWLNSHFIGVYLCKDCSTGRVAQITDSSMRPFMRVNATAPERIRFLLHPFHYYARNRVLLRITSGELAGLEGYVIRIDRDRRLVMDVGGISVAISGVHAEKFEEVNPDRMPAAPDIFYERNLHERNALIDRYFHPVNTARQADVQAGNIDYLRDYVSKEVANGRMTLAEAWHTYTFIIEEIAYYFAPFAETLADILEPIFSRGCIVLQNMNDIIHNPDVSLDQRLHYENGLQELMTKYDYLF